MEKINFIENVIGYLQQKRELSKKKLNKLKSRAELTEDAQNFNSNIDYQIKLENEITILRNSIECLTEMKLELLLSTNLFE